MVDQARTEAHLKGTEAPEDLEVGAEIHPTLPEALVPTITREVKDHLAEDHLEEAHLMAAHQEEVPLAEANPEVAHPAVAHPEVHQAAHQDTHLEAHRVVDHPDPHMEVTEIIGMMNGG